jgi:hypothetical protein
MPNLEFPTLNGVAPSWADIQTTFVIGGGPLIFMTDIAALKWSRKVDVGKQRGASGGRILKQTTGQVDYDASATLYRSGKRALIKGLMTQGIPRGRQLAISGVGFDVLIQHTPPGEIEIYQVKLKGCRFLGDADDMKEGADPDKIEVTLNPIEIVDIINGIEVAML